MSLLVPVVMSGGIGSRLWPLSSASRPKQFQPLIGSRSMLAETLARADGFGAAEIASPLVVCNAAHGHLALEALDDAGFGDGTAILEPEGKNTAAAAALACHHALSQAPDALVLLMPADHHIERVDVLHRAVADAIPLAAEGRLCTFGVQPDRPSSAYGYIQAGEALQSGFEIQRFVEKPKPPTAQAYLDAGGYYWNAGIFLLNAASFLSELERLRPDIADPTARAYEKGRSEGRLYMIDADIWSTTGSESIDYAVAEKTSGGAVFPVDMGWSDVGSWDVLYGLADKDSDGNVRLGETALVGVNNCYVRSAAGRLTAVIGAEDLVIVDTDDAILVAHKDHAQDVKKVVELIADK